MVLPHRAKLRQTGEFDLLSDDFFKVPWPLARSGELC